MASKSTDEAPGEVTTARDGHTYAGKKRGRKPQQALIATPELRKARASVIVEQAMAGVPHEVIGQHFNLTRQTISNELRWAKEHGIIEEVRDRIRQELLPKAVNVLNDILNTDASTLADRTVLKGHELKAKVAKQVAEGIGAFRKESSPKIVTKEVKDLSWYVQQREARLNAAVRDLGRSPDEHALGAGNGAGADPGGADAPDAVDGVVRLIPEAPLVGEVAGGRDHDRPQGDEGADESHIDRGRD